MTTYLVISGAIANLFIILLIIGSAISQISTKRRNKKMAAEEAIRETKYKEELKTVEKIWQEWARKLHELKQCRANTKNIVDHLSADIEIITHKYQKHHFASTNRSEYLVTLGQENGWVLQEESTQSA